MNTQQYSCLIEAMNLAIGHIDKSDSAFVRTLCKCLKEHKEFKANELTVEKAIEMLKDHGFFIEGENND